jgi:pyridoxamine 5'-phosphate oxidase
MVIQLPKEESDSYFDSRDLPSKATVVVSKQSQPIAGTYTEFLNQCADIESESLSIKRPPYWGGYSIIPQTIEFWQGAEARRHHRRSFTLKNGTWTRQDLYP